MTAAKHNITLAAKCAPREHILADVACAEIEAVELYTDPQWLERLDEVKRVCEPFDFRWAIHAPNKGFQPERLAELARAIGAKVMVFHCIYWEDEWVRLVEAFDGVETTLCAENITTALESLPLMRRYGFGRCLDLEHVQLECAGLNEEDFLPLIAESTHIHLTGYVHGSESWHTHVHHSPEHGERLLRLVKNSGFSGMIVSEARARHQSLDEFRQLKAFVDECLARP